MSVPRFAFTLSALGGKLYAAGGRALEGQPQASVEAYDPQQDRWEAVAPMTEPRTRHVMAVM